MACPAKLHGIRVFLCEIGQITIHLIVRYEFVHRSHVGMQPVFLLCQAEQRRERVSFEGQDPVPVGFQYSTSQFGV